MAEAWAKETYAFWRPVIKARREHIVQLTWSLLRFRPNTFRSLSETGSRSAFKTTYALLGLSIISAAVYFVVNPLTAHTNWEELGRFVFGVNVVMTLCGPLAFWLMTRPIGGVASLAALLNLGLITTMLLSTVALVVLFVGAFASGGFAEDLATIQGGHGRDTHLFRLMCAPFEKQAEALSVQKQLNDMDHGLDIAARLVARYGENVPQAALSDLRAKKLAAFDALTIPDKEKYVELSIRDRDMYLEQVPSQEDIDYASERYWPVGLAMITVVFFNLLAGLYTLTFVVVMLVAPHPGFVSRLFWTLRICLAGLVAAALCYGVVRLQQGSPILIHGTLGAQIAVLEGETRGMRPYCGDLNSFDLW